MYTMFDLSYVSLFYLYSLLLRRKLNNSQDSVDVKIIDFGLSKVSKDHFTIIPSL